MKIYIAGKITGLDIDEAFANFRRAEVALITRGHTVINPMRLSHNHDKTWQSYMKECLIAMMHCDAVFALDNSMRSKGATTEITIARILDIPVYIEGVDMP